MASQTKLAAALAASPTTRKGPVCGVTILISKLEGAERQELVTALQDPAVSSRHLCAAIKAAYEFTLPYATLIRHRAGNCQCHD